MTKSKAVEPVYAKISILESSKYKDRKDLLDILLKDSKKYTIKEVDTILNKELKRKL